jgi:hypothetical protein
MFMIGSPNFMFMIGLIFFQKKIETHQYYKKEGSGRKNTTGKQTQELYR